MKHANLLAAYIFCAISIAPSSSSTTAVDMASHSIDETYRSTSMMPSIIVERAFRSCISLVGDPENPCSTVIVSGDMTTTIAKYNTTAEPTTTSTTQQAGDATAITSLPSRATTNTPASVTVIGPTSSLTNNAAATYVNFIGAAAGAFMVIAGLQFWRAIGDGLAGRDEARSGCAKREVAWHLDTGILKLRIRGWKMCSWNSI